MGYGNGGYETGSAAALQSESLDRLRGDAPSRLPMVPSEVAKADKQVECLHKLVSELEARLSAVTRSEPPSPGGIGKEAAIHSVHMVGALMEINGRLEAACARLSSLTQRLEV